MTWPQEGSSIVQTFGASDAAHCGLFAPGIPGAVVHIPCAIQSPLARVEEDSLQLCGAEPCAALAATGLPVLQALLGYLSTWCLQVGCYVQVHGDRTGPAPLSEARHLFLPLELLA